MTCQSKMIMNLISFSLSVWNPWWFPFYNAKVFLFLQINFLIIGKFEKIVINNMAYSQILSLIFAATPHLAYIILYNI